MARKAGFKHVSKSQVVALLDKQAGVSASELVCSAEAAAMLQCWAELEVAPTGDEASTGCEQYENALRQCEKRMHNRPVQMAKADIRRSLIFHMLRLANRAGRK